MNKIGSYVYIVESARKYSKNVRGLTILKGKIVDTDKTFTFVEIKDERGDTVVVPCLQATVHDSLTSAIKNISEHFEPPRTSEIQEDKKNVLDNELGKVLPETTGITEE